MRSNDVKDLLAHVKDSLVRIKNTYDKALQKKDMPADLRISVKNVMENLRSVLDYMALDVRETISQKQGSLILKKKKERIYFPYGEDKKKFDTSVETNLPDLKTISPSVYSLIEGLQPHECGDMWLWDFCQILNKNKHDRLSPQTRTSRTNYSVGLAGEAPAISAPAWAIEAPPGEIMIGEIPLTFDLSTGVPQKTPGLEVEVVTWVSFMFQSTNVEVYPLLTVAFHKITEMSVKLYENLEKIRQGLMV